MLRSTQPRQSSSSNNILGINLDGEKLLVVYGNPNGMVYERLVVPVPEDASFAAVVELIMLQADKLLTLTQAHRVCLCVPAVLVIGSRPWGLRLPPNA